MSKMKTMLKSEKRNSASRYYITKADKMFNVINSGLNRISKEAKRNLAYSLRYLEFLQLQLDELVLDDMMIKMIHKNFIITSLAIIELIMQDSTNANVYGEKLLIEFRNKNLFNLKDEDFEKLDKFRKLR
ncbi:TPA: hypothetical protein ACRBUF_001077, partial [Streptococcus pyogenes]